MDRPFKILGFAGSLRKGSYNRSLLRAAAQLAPTGTSIEVFDLEGIPPFNQDFERTPPDRVKEFKAKIREADALLIVTPEYNYSVPGVLKNAIDWASRPYGDNAFEGKLVGIMSASTGMLGGARAQYHLRQMFVFLDVYTLNRPEVMLAHADKSIDANGNLTNEVTVGLVKALLANLAERAQKMKR